MKCSTCENQLSKIEENDTENTKSQCLGCGNEEIYNGWTNWETWNTNLWLCNDETTNEYAKTAAIYGTTENLIAVAKDRIPATEGIDFDKVNWDEIKAAFIESIGK